MAFCFFKFGMVWFSHPGSVQNFYFFNLVSGPKVMVSIISMNWFKYGGEVVVIIFILAIF